MSKSGFGERLKRERELRGVSRDEICAATRISTRFLEALESERWEMLPGGIFNRGFVRAVARFLGLDEDDLVADYDLAISEQGSPIEASVRPPVPQDSAKRRRGRFVLLGALCAIVLLGTAWLGWRWEHKELRQAANDSNHALPAVAAAGHAEETAPGTSAESAGGAALAPSASPLGTEIPGLQLKIEAGKETDVSVYADGSRVFEGSMIAGQSRTFRAQEAIDISAKDAGALLLELNGQTLAPLGPPGQPGNVTLTRSDLKPTGGGAD
jgi:cytoskeletal protein RodZ